MTPTFFVKQLMADSQARTNKWKDKNTTKNDGQKRTTNR
jgi:hypothetical protein